MPRPSLAVFSLLLTACVPSVDLAPSDPGAACYPICDALFPGETNGWDLEPGVDDPSRGWCVCYLSDGDTVPVAVNVEPG